MARNVCRVSLSRLLPAESSAVFGKEVSDPPRVSTALGELMLDQLRHDPRLFGVMLARLRDSDRLAARGGEAICISPHLLLSVKVTAKALLVGFYGLASAAPRL
jgi:hypothetical protein